MKSPLHVESQSTNNLWLLNRQMLLATNQLSDVVLQGINQQPTGPLIIKGDRGLLLAARVILSIQKAI